MVTFVTANLRHTQVAIINCSRFACIQSTGLFAERVALVYSLIIALQARLLTTYCVCNRKHLHRQGNVCNISSLFVIVRINPVMSRISIFNKQLEFVSADIGIEFIAHFKKPD